MKSKSLFLLFPQRVIYENPETPGAMKLEATDSVDEYQIPSMIQKRNEDEKSDIGKRLYLARIGKRQVYQARIG
ncbi:hypothetical protein FO519_002087 [Halicephalobus sp. NKZ332]|nr:hypothetical protein FO519_002087 [Halicephalobus sp. NKZ332]